MDKYNFFQQTPQKDEKNNTSWSSLTNTSIVPAGNQNTPFGISQPPNTPFGSSSSIFSQKTPFGTSNTNVFGTTPMSTFGTIPTSTFGTTPTNTFGTPSNTSTFGTTPTNTFGTPSNTSTFGTTPTNTFGTPSNTSTFGTTPTNTFGTPSNTSAFGTTPTSTFGTTPTSTFGTPSNTSAFGTTPNTNTSSVGFGTQSASPFSTGNSPFTSSTGSSIFGSATGSGWGSQPSTTGWSTNSKGSKVAPYSVTRIKEDTGIFSDLVDITGMREYSNKSVDEIRKEDYEMSFCPPKQSTSLSSGIGLPSSATGSIFGSTQSTSQSPFGLQTGFSNSGFGSVQQQNNNTSGFSIGTPQSQSNTPFGLSSGILQKPLGTSTFNTSSQFNPISQQTSNTGSLFGNNPIQSQTSSIFGAKPASDSTLVAPSSFSSTLDTQPKPISNLFGAQSTTNPFGGTSNTNSSLFGGSAQSSSLQPSSNLFGGTSNQPTTSSLFGGSNTNSSLFGGASNQPSTSNLFGGASNQPSASNLFGGASNQPSTSNLFGGLAQPSSFQPSTTGNTLFGQQTINPFNQNNTSSSFFNYSQPSAIMSKVDLTDPFMIKNVHFEKFEQQKPSIKTVLPTPIFKTNKEVPVVELKIRPPKPIQKSSIYTIPDLKDLDTTKSITNLVVGFEGKGRIEFLEPVSVSSIEDLEKRVSFRNENIEISDPIGMGLNKKARVYIEGLYPVCRTTNEIIKGKVDVFPQKGIQERFIYQLKNDSNKKYVDYNVETGIYVYEVNHF